MNMQTNKKTDEEIISRRFEKLAAISAGHFMNDFYMGLIPPISFVFAEVLGLNMTLQGLLAFVITSFGSFAQPFVGGFVDRHGKSYLLTGSVLWIAFWMSIAGWIRNYYILLVAVSLGALASALYHPLGSSTAVKLGRDSKGKVLSIFMTIGGLSAAVAPAVALPLVNAYGLESLAFLMIPGAIIAGFMYWSGIQEVEIKSAPSSGGSKKDSIMETVRKLFVLVMVSVNKSFIRRVMVAFGIQILIMKGLSLKAAGFLLALNLFMNPLGTMIGGYMNDRYGSRKTLMLFNGMVGILMGTIIFGSGIFAAGAFSFLGMCLSASNTPSVIIAHDLLPDKASTGFGLVMGFAGGVGGFGLLLVGRVSDVYGLPAASLFMIVPVVLLVVLSWRLLETEKPDRLAG